MPNVISKETSLSLFADDSKRFRLILGREDGGKLQDELNKLFQWSCTWGMKLNTEKCKVSRVARIRSIYDRDFYLGEIKLDRVDVEGLVMVVMGLGCVHWGHQVHPPNAEKCPPSQIGSATKSAVAHPRCDPGNAVLYCS